MTEALPFLSDWLRWLDQLQELLGLRSFERDPHLKGVRALFDSDHTPQEAAEILRGWRDG